MIVAGDALVKALGRDNDIQLASEFDANAATFRRPQHCFGCRWFAQVTI